MGRGVWGPATKEDPCAVSVVPRPTRRHHKDCFFVRSEAEKWGIKSYKVLDGYHHLRPDTLAELAVLTGEAMPLVPAAGADESVMTAEEGFECVGEGGGVTYSSNVGGCEGSCCGCATRVLHSRRCRCRCRCRYWRSSGSWQLPELEA